MQTILYEKEPLDANAVIITGKNSDCSDSESTDEEEAAFFARMEQRNKGDAGAGSCTGRNDKRKVEMRKVIVQSAEVIDLCD